MLPDITPEMVAAAVPGADVTPEQVQEAVDWAEPILEHYQVIILPDSRQERAIIRAVSYYALHLAAGGQASTLRTSTTVKAVVSERKKVGPLEKEQKFADASTSAAGFLISADEWLHRAWAALYAAGLPRGSMVVGASR